MALISPFEDQEDEVVLRREEVGQRALLALELLLVVVHGDPVLRPRVLVTLGLRAASDRGGLVDDEQLACYRVLRALYGIATIIR